MVDEKYRWIYSYTLPCTFGDEERFYELLSKPAFSSWKDYSRERVREHFLGEHNKSTLAGLMSVDRFHNAIGVAHLALPYNIIQRGDSHFFCDLHSSVRELPISPHRVLQLEDVNYAVERGVLNLGDEAIILHMGRIAESCSIADVEKYAERLANLGKMLKASAA